MKSIKIITLLIITLFLLSCGGKTMTNKTATFHTSLGTIEIELFEEEMPITTENFIKLAKEGFYDGTKFHRVIPGFMVQGGDPLSADDSKKNAWGTGGPGYSIKDEFDKSLSNSPGTIAMANAGPNTGGSQFFVNLVNNNFLDSKHPVFGKVVSGMDVVESIGKVKTGQADRPVEDVVIEKIIIK
ncbi:peptidylprolyl isomerase [Candidatus Woesearchaeota archaeon]|jgi:peptidylprolyl isomerase|nr:peptidylprolyl isomerase [Candidatus Woesearchaeota archaeon]